MRHDSDVGVLLAQERVRFDQSLVMLREQDSPPLELDALLVEDNEVAHLSS